MREPLMTSEAEIKMVLLVEKTGNITALYSEAIDINTLGNPSIKRWSHIEYDNVNCLWTVRMAGSKKIIHRNASREECLKWEKKRFIRWLKAGAGKKQS